MKQYLAFDIGCIECGETSNPIGIFETEELAKEACDKAEAKQRSNWHGQHSFEVFEIDN